VVGPKVVKDGDSRPAGGVGGGRRGGDLRDAARRQGSADREHIQLPVDRGVPGSAGVDQVARDLGILHPTGGAGVLALHPHRAGAFLEIAGLVDDQHRLRVAEILHQVGAHVVADPVVIPHRPTQQVLHPIRAGILGVLGDRSAVLAGQIRQQPAHERPGPPSRLHPAKPARDPTQQLFQAGLPSRGVNV
jgi:hypothetical protein